MYVYYYGVSGRPKHDSKVREAQIFKNASRVLVLSPTAAALHRACRWVTLFLATNTEGSIHLLLTSMLPPHLCECLGSCRVQRSRTLLCRLSRVTELSPSLLVFFFFLCCHSWRCNRLANQTLPTRSCKRPVDFCGCFLVSVDNTHRQHTDLRTPGAAE